jgi:hypothetical protein
MKRIGGKAAWLAARWMVLGLAFGLAAWLTTGCDEEDDDFLDHNPPAGQGSLVIDNNTLEDIDLFVNGTRTNRVNNGAESILDLAPGTYRIVLDSDDSDRLYADDVDILEGRLAILHVTIDILHPNEFDVSQEYED